MSAKEIMAQEPQLTQDTKDGLLAQVREGKDINFNQEMDGSEPACPEVTAEEEEVGAFIIPDPLEGHIKEISEARWKIDNQYLFLVYVGEMDKKALRTSLCKKLKERKRDPKEVLIGHGSRDSQNNYVKTLVYLDCGGRFQTSNRKFFDFGNNYPCIFKVEFDRSGRSRTAVKLHVCESDEELAEYKAKLLAGMKSIFAKVKACKTTEEAIEKYVVHPNDIHGIEKMREYAEENLQMDEKKLEELIRYPWQKNLIEKLQGPPDDRKVTWIYDPDGGCGKSKLALYLKFKGQAEVFTQVGGQYHMGTIMEGLKKIPRILILDLPRDHEEKGSLYSVLESLKNGYITSVKFKGKTVYFGTLHVVVLANFAPNPKKMSNDRWGDTHKMTWIKKPSKSEDGKMDYGELKIEPISIHEVQTLFLEGEKKKQKEKIAERVSYSLLRQEGADGVWEQEGIEAFAGLSF